VNPEDSVTFWCWYDLETNYDVTVVEVSENTKEWFNLDTTRFNGNSGGWVRKAYSLQDWLGKSVYIRFRAMTDGSVLNNGFYVDDVYPVCLFNDVDTVATDITDTLYDFVDHPAGEYFYLVRGFNTTWGWGDYSCLARVEVSVGIDQGDIANPTETISSISLLQNPSTNQLRISYTLGNVDPEAARLSIYDATGRLVKSFRIEPNATRNTVAWNCYDESGEAVPNGIYFVQLESGNDHYVKKAILLR